MFGRKRRTHPDVAPAPADGLIAAIDAQLRAIAEIPPAVRTEQQWDYLDRLLDARSAPADVRPLIRPAVPVIPGGEGGSR
jgi:hypothetical protein